MATLVFALLSALCFLLTLFSVTLGDIDLSTLGHLFLALAIVPWSRFSD